MIKNKKKLVAEDMPEFQASIDVMPADSKIFVDKSLEIADYIFWLMEVKGLKQKDLADKMGKSEAEVSKILGGMHNFTLRMLSKLEAALEEEVICTPAKKEVASPFVTSCKMLEGIRGIKQQKVTTKILYEKVPCR